MRWSGSQTASAEKTNQKTNTCTLGDKGGDLYHPTGTVEALTGLPLLDLLIQSDARSAVHRLWSLGCWSYLHPDRGHSSILMRLQKSDPKISMGVAVMRSAFHLEPKYRVTMLTREECTRRPGTPLVIKGLVTFTDGSKMMEGTGAWVYGQSLGRKLSIPLEKHTTVFQAEVYVILAWIYETETQGRPEKYVNICSDSQAAMKALQAARTSPLVQ